MLSLLRRLRLGEAICSSKYQRGRGMPQYRLQPGFRA